MTSAISFVCSGSPSQRGTREAARRLPSGRRRRRRCAETRTRRRRRGRVGRHASGWVSVMLFTVDAGLEVRSTVSTRQNALVTRAGRGSILGPVRSDQALRRTSRVSQKPLSTRPAASVRRPPAARTDAAQEGPQRRGSPGLRRTGATGRDAGARTACGSGGGRSALQCPAGDGADRRTWPGSHSDGVRVVERPLRPGPPGLGLSCGRGTALRRKQPSDRPPAAGTRAL